MQCGSVMSRVHAWLFNPVCAAAGATDCGTGVETGGGQQEMEVRPRNSKPNTRTRAFAVYIGRGRVQQKYQTKAGPEEGGGWVREGKYTIHNKAGVVNGLFES